MEGRGGSHCRCSCLLRCVSYCLAIQPSNVPGCNWKLTACYENAVEQFLCAALPNPTAATLTPIDPHCLAPIQYDAVRVVNMNLVLLWIAHWIGVHGRRVAGSRGSTPLRDPSTPCPALTSTPVLRQRQTNMEQANVTPPLAIQRQAAEPTAPESPVSASSTVGSAAVSCTCHGACDVFLMCTASFEKACAGFSSADLHTLTYFSAHPAALPYNTS